MIKDEKILDTLGYTVCKGLKNVKGEELGDFKVPRLPSHKALRLRPTILSYMQKILNDAKNKTEDDKITQADIIEMLSDEEGINLKFELIGVVFGGIDEETIGNSIDTESVNTLYAHIIRRDFFFNDLLEEFQSTFSSIFGAPKKVLDSPLEARQESEN